MILTYKTMKETGLSRALYVIVQTSNNQPGNFLL